MFFLWKGQQTIIYLNEWWPSLTMHICGSSGGWVNSEVLEQCYVILMINDYALDILYLSHSHEPCTSCSFITLRPRQHGHHFPEDIFKCIFLNENVWIVIDISLKFVPQGPFNNIPASVQIMAWRRPGDKPLSEPMMITLLIHICVTRSQWVILGSLLLTGDLVCMRLMHKYLHLIISLCCNYSSMPFNGMWYNWHWSQHVGVIPSSVGD